MARLMALGVFAFLSGVTLVTSADPRECSGDRCEGGSDSNILMQKHVEVSAERIIPEDQVYTEDQMQSGAFDIALVSDNELIAEDQMRGSSFDIKDLEKVQAEVEEMVSSGKRPEIQNMQKIKTMVQAMGKELKTTHRVAVEDLKLLKEAVKTTNVNALQAQQNIKSTIEVQVVEAEKNHSTCRVAEAPLNASKIGKCTKLTKFVTEIALPAIRPTSNEPAMMGPYLKAMKEYFCCQDGQDHPPCETKHDIFVKLDTNCTDATKAYDAHRKTCNAYQTRYEADFCDWRTKLTDECTAYLGSEGTYPNAVKAYDRKVAATELLAGTPLQQQEGTSQWKTEYAAIHKILCYVDVWMNDNNANTTDKAKLLACKADIDTSPMNVVYPGVACPVKCSTTPVEKHPGTQGFAAEYAKLAQKVAAVLPCLNEVARGLPGGPAPTVATPAPTPPPPPPTTTTITTTMQLPVGFPSPSPFPGELPPLTLYDQNENGEEEDAESGAEAGAWKLLFCGHCGSVGTTWKTHPDLAGCEGHCQGMGKKLLIYNPAHKNCRCYEDGHCSSNKASSCGGGYVYKLSQAAPPPPAPPPTTPPMAPPAPPAPPTIGKPTCGGDAAGAKCQFPFKWKNIEYKACTKVDHHQMWCYTTTPGKWGNCDCATTAPPVATTLPPAQAPIPQESKAALPVPPTPQQSNAAPPGNGKCIEETYSF